MGDPALVFGAELVRPVDAAHAKDDRRQAERARVVEHVLVGRALRAAVRAVEVERARLSRCRARRPTRPRHVAQAALAQRDIVEVAVDLVRGREQQAAADRASARIASSRFSVPRALTSKSCERIVRLVVTATCAAKWNTRVDAGDRRGDGGRIADVADLQFDPVAVAARAATRRCARHRRARGCRRSARARRRRSSRSARLVPTNRRRR